MYTQCQQDNKYPAVECRLCGGSGRKVWDEKWIQGSLRHEDGRADMFIMDCGLFHCGLETDCRHVGAMFFNGFSNSEQTCESFIYLSFTHICSESLEPFLRFMGIRWSLSCHLDSGTVSLFALTSDLTNSETVAATLWERVQNLLWASAQRKVLERCGFW